MIFFLGNLMDNVLKPGTLVEIYDSIRIPSYGYLCNNSKEISIKPHTLGVVIEIITESLHNHRIWYKVLVENQLVYICEWYLRPF